MKKLLSLVLLLSVALTVNAQPCTPNPIYADSSAGIWPDTMPVARQCEPYSMVFDIKTLTDTCVTSPMAVCVWVRSMRIASVSAPNGFVYAADVSPWVNGGTPPNLTPVQGCVNVSAPQSAVAALSVGMHNIVVTVDMEVRNQDPNSPILATWTWASTLGASFTYTYGLEVEACSALQELDANRFSVAPNFPNPFTGTTTIPFNTTREEACTFKVYNMLGMLVHQNTFTAKAGKNMYIMDASKLQSGMYVFTMSNGKETVTRKMTIQN